MSRASPSRYYAALLLQNCRCSAELRAALEDAKKQSVSCLFDIKVLPKTMTPGFESWWRVGVAEVSKSETVAAAYEDMQKNIAKTFDY